MTAVVPASEKLSKLPFWKEWLSPRDSGDEINKLHQEKLFKVFNSSVSEETIERDLKEYTELVFLFEQNFDNHRGSIF